MLNKVLKKLKSKEKKSKDDLISTNNLYPTSKLQKRTGFHAKTNSQAGAERQRSIGNRMNKPPR